jgi:hypothetical protein
MKNRIENIKAETNGHAQPGAKAPDKKKARFTEYTVTIRLKPERQEWFSQMSDRLGLTREQAGSVMLESNMEAAASGSAERWA